MATNYVSEGKRMELPTVSGAESGDAFVVGSFLPCVLLTDAETASPYNASVATQGVFDLSVKAHDGSSGSAVVVGDSLYWTDKDTALDKDASEDPFGIALEAIDSGSTATIKVMLIPKVYIASEITASMLGAAAVETAKIKDENVTLAKIEDLTRGSIISGQTASNRPDELDISGDGEILVGDGTDVNAVAVSGDATLANTGALSLADHTIKYAEKSFSAAQIKTLYSANSNKGLELVAAQGADTVVEFISAVMFYDYDGANAYTAANGITVNLGTTAVGDTVGNTFLQATADKVAICQALSAEVIADDTDVVNKALYLQEGGTTDPTGASTTAADQLIVKVAYRVHDFS